MTKKDAVAAKMLDELESLMVKVESSKEVEVKDWLAIARPVYFLLERYVREHSDNK